MVNQSLFFKPRDPRLAKIISTKSPEAFRRSIRILMRGGLTTKEKRGLILAQNRSRAQLKRKNLSPKERREFTQIVQTKIPNISKRR